MALFGSSKAPLPKLLKGEFKSEEEKLQLLSQLREDNGVKAAELLPLVFSPDATLRQNAAALFVSRADAKAVTALVQEMHSQHQAARAFGVRVISRVKGELLRPALDALLKDPSPARAKVGWEVALELPPELRIPYAERALKEAPEVVKVTALQRLMADKGGAAGLLPQLMELATGNEDRLRERAVEALSSMGDKAPGEVLDLMLERMTKDNATVRAHAATFVRDATTRRAKEMRPRLLKMVSEGDDTMRRLVLEILLASGEPKDVVLEVLDASRSMLGWLRTRVLNSLKTFGDDVLRPAVTLLEHPDEDVRMQALVLCEHFEDPRLVGPVVKLLNDQDWWLRITACETLGKLKDPRCVPHLVRALDDQDTRWSAIDALGSIGTEPALQALERLLTDERAEVRLEVMQGMSRSNSPKNVAIFQKAVQSDPSQEVRTRAAEMLREMGAGQGSAEAMTSAVRAGSLERPLDRLLAEAREKGASDIHITVGEPPFFRVNGVVQRVSIPALDEDTSRKWVTEILDPVRAKMFDDAGEVDFCHAIPNVGRYRANAFVQRKGVCAAFRCIPNIPPTFADLRLPGHLTDLLDYHQGLILVSGPAGGGKSTTLAAVINLINETKSDHVITLEDPIEFVHPAKSSLVNQREVGRHTESFARALRAALREDPDVIMVGEMRDVETVRMALMAAETGHLVVATMHTTSAVATVDRLIESFPPDEQQQVRMGLSESLKYVVSQSLVPRADGKGRVAVYEILKGTHSIGSLIRDAKSYQIPSVMQISRNHGMQNVDMALEELLDAGLITPETAYARAEKKETFEARLSDVGGAHAAVAQ